MQKMKDTLVRQFSDFKTQTVDMVKNRLFCCFAVLVALIVPALFLDWAIFVVCAAAGVLFVLLKFDDGLAVLLFLYPFFAIFNYGEATLYSVLFDVAVLIFAVKYVVEVVKKEKELKTMIAALKVGDEVATIGGIHGKIFRIKDDLFILESGAGTNKSYITVDRSAVSRFIRQAEENKGPTPIPGAEVTETDAE